jgi:hypothetical protein
MAPSSLCREEGAAGAPGDKMMDATEPGSAKVRTASPLRRSIIADSVSMSHYHICCAVGCYRRFQIGTWMHNAAAGWLMTSLSQPVCRLARRSATESCQQGSRIPPGTGSEEIGGYVQGGSFRDPFCQKPATRLSRKDWHFGGNRAVVWLGSTRPHGLVPGSCPDGVIADAGLRW